MKNITRSLPTVAAALTLGCALAASFAGSPQKWETLPKALQDGILANGGAAGMTVDKEDGQTKNGLDVYEASIKDKKGVVTDLVFTADGKLVEKKNDAAADAAAEQTAREARGVAVLKGVKFSHPTQITNPFLPLSSLKQDIIEGSEDGKKTRVERTVKPEIKRTFKVGEQWVESLAFEDRAFEDGALSEVAIDYFAQDDAGNVYYFGEDSDEYKDGKVISHEGTWALGRDTVVPGVLFPAKPVVGLKFISEDVSAEIFESDEVVALDETVVVPAGTYKNCVKIKESLGDGSVEFKYYAPGVGVVRETPSEGDELLISHNGSKPVNPIPVFTPATKPATTTAPATSADAMPQKLPSYDEAKALIDAYKTAHPGRGGKDWDILAKSPADIAADPAAQKLLALCGPNARPIIPMLAWEYGGGDHPWIKPEASALVYIVYIPTKENSEHWSYDKAKDHVTADVYVLYPDKNPAKDKEGRDQVASCIGDNSNFEILVDTASLKDGKDAGLNLSEASTELRLILPDGKKVNLYDGK